MLRSAYMRSSRRAGGSPNDRRGASPCDDVVSVATKALRAHDGATAAGALLSVAT